MTDRVHALTVVLEHDHRDDDVMVIVHAILALRGVLSVQPHVTDSTMFTANMRLRTEMREKLYALIDTLR